MVILLVILFVNISVRNRISAIEGIGIDVAFLNGFQPNSLSMMPKEIKLVSCI